MHNNVTKTPGGPPLHWSTVSTVAPHECSPCRYCGKRDDMYAELPEHGDFQPPIGNNRGFVMRIGCLCQDAIDNDLRSEFNTYAEAIAEWNRMMTDTAWEKPSA